MSQTFMVETDDGEEFLVHGAEGPIKPIPKFGKDGQGPETDFITTTGEYWTVYKGERVPVNDLHDGRFRIITGFGDKIARRKDDK